MPPHAKYLFPFHLQSIFAISPLKGLPPYPLKMLSSFKNILQPQYSKYLPSLPPNDFPTLSQNIFHATLKKHVATSAKNKFYHPTAQSFRHPTPKRTYCCHPPYHNIMSLVQFQHLCKEHYPIKSKQAQVFMHSLT